MKKRIISMILAICCVLTLLPMGAVRVDAAHLSRQEFHSDRKINPLYEDVLSLEDLPPAPERLPDRGPDAAGSHDHEVARPLNDFSDFVPAMDAVALIRDQLVAREEEFTIQFAMVNNMSVEEGAEILLDLAMAHTGVANEGDYLRWQWVTFDFDGQYWEDTFEGLYYVEINYYLSYFTTAKQEAKMDEAVDDLLTELDLEDKTDYVKVKTVYDYICENVTYDFDHLEDPEYYLMFSAYAALVDKTAVCQGYALLLYRLLLELGIDTRVIVGVQTSTAIPHAWNIVELFDEYYNLDSTWDAGMSEYSFFLRSNENFVDHTRDPAYNTADFNYYYPMAANDFEALMTGVRGGTTWQYDCLTGVLTLEGSAVGTHLSHGLPTALCQEVNKVVLKEGITAIGLAPFYMIRDGIWYFLPKSLTSIDVYAFHGADNTLVFTGDAPKIDENAFSSCGITAYYPEENETWTTDSLQDYGAWECKWVPYSPVRILEQPKSVYADDGAEVEIEVNAVGDGLTYAWYYKNPGSSKFKLTTSFTGNTYTTTMSEARSGRQVYCVITDQYGNSVTTDTATLAMTGSLVVIKQPQSVKVGYNEEATVTVEAMGEGLTYAWYYKNPGASKFILTKTFKGNTYSVAMNGERAGRQVYCVIKDKNGNKVKTDVVTLSMEVTPLEITKQPESVSVPDGMEVTVSVEATGDDLTYQWYYKNAGGSKFLLTKTFTGNSYTITMNADRDGRQIYCLITDAHGNKIKTEVATLTMYTGVQIESLPDTVVAVKGETATVTVNATGHDLTYQWYYKSPGSSKFKLTTSFTGNTYSVEMTDDRVGRQVYCVVTDKYGNTATSEIVTLGMEVPLSILQQPQNVAALEGETVTITVEAEGDGLTYAWYYKNAGGSKFYLTKTFTGNTYTAVVDAERNGRQVYCVITDQYGNSVKTNVVTMSMIVPNPVTITKQPENVAATEGQTVTITVEATGDGLTYAWYYKNPGASKFKLTTSFTGNIYTTEMSAARDGRQVYCVITDQYGNSVQSDVATMTMVSARDLVILEQPESTKVVPGGTAGVMVEAMGDGLQYTWYRKLVNDTTYRIDRSSTTNVLPVTLSAVWHACHVYCVITDQYGNSVTTDVATIEVEEYAQILFQTETAKAPAGEEVTVRVDAKGDGLTYAWYYKNRNDDEFKLTDSFTRNTYTVEMNSARKGRQVYCVITDEYGNTVTSKVVELEIGCPELRITKQPESRFMIDSVEVEILVGAEGNGLSYQWYYQDEGGEACLDPNNTSNVYRVILTFELNGRNIWCVITDRYGNQVTSDTAQLLVE